MLPPSRTILMPLLLKMVAAAAALVMFCGAAEAAINPKHGNRVVSMHLQHISLFIYPHCPCASPHSLLQVQVCRLQSPPPPTPADAVLAPFLPSMSLYTFEVPLLLFPSCCTHSRPHPSPLTPQPPPYARPRDAALAAAAVGTCLEEPLSFAASVIGALKHAFFWSRFR